MSNTPTHPEMSPEMQPTLTQLADRLLGSVESYQGSQGDTVALLGIGRLKDVEASQFPQVWALHKSADDEEGYALLNLTAYLPGIGYATAGEAGHKTGERITFGRNMMTAIERKVSNASNTGVMMDGGDVVKMLQDASVLSFEDQREVLKAIEDRYRKRVVRHEEAIPRAQLHDLSRHDLSLFDERTFKPSWRIPAMEELMGGYKTERRASKFGGWFSGRKRAA